MEDFQLLKGFRLNIVPPRPRVVKEVIWSPLLRFWFKGNSDGVSLANLDACGGLFRDHNGVHIDSVSCFWARSVLFAEFMGAILLMEHALSSSWQSLWLKMVSYSSLKLSPILFWCLGRSKIVDITAFALVFHIYQKGNHCAYILTSLGLTLRNYTWWDNIHSDISHVCIKNL